MTFFTERLVVRVRDGTKQVIGKYCDKYPQIFDNESHFVRCAIERELRYQRKNGRYVVEGVGRV